MVFCESLKMLKRYWNLVSQMSRRHTPDQPSVEAFQNRFGLSTPSIGPELLESLFLFTQIGWNRDRNRGGTENLDGSKQSPNGSGTVPHPVPMQITER
jgi:hypothetical protein